MYYLGLFYKAGFALLGFSLLVYLFINVIGGFFYCFINEVNLYDNYRECMKEYLEFLKEPFKPKTIITILTFLLLIDGFVVFSIFLMKSFVYICNM